MCLLLIQVTPTGATGKLLPVKFSDVTIEDAFWTTRLETNRLVSIPHNLDYCEQTGRIRNFEQAAGLDNTPYAGHYFHDSDVFKVLEGVAYSLSTHPDPALESQLDRIIDLIARSQQPDGYLNTWFTLKEPDQRWKNIRDKHELYCAGHMFEAAVAHFHATGKRTFLDVACRYADYIDSVFGPEPHKRHTVAGHEEIELALIKLWRATGNERYLKLSKYFVYEHGQKDTHDLFGKYCQDHLPIEDQTEPVGHAVRWLYLYSAVADHAAISGDQGHIDAMERLWQNIVKKKMYMTGGVGVQNYGEGFAEEYYLPNYQAYCETCASIGMAFWNHRLALLHGEGRFADIVERVLYNGALAGISLAGDKFFYVNPLASDGGHHRQPFYGCACCPTNVVRFISSIGDYVYGKMTDGSGVYVLQYIGGTGKIALNDQTVALTQDTKYPWEGKVRIAVKPEQAATFTISLRIPDWCEGASIEVNGQAVRTTTTHGFAAISRPWQPGDTITLDLPMPVRQVAAAPQVKDNIGRLALMRGPIVYCLEDCDNPCAVDQAAIASGAAFETHFQPDLLDGVVTLAARGKVQRIVEKDNALGFSERAVDLTAIPYYAWDNREPGNMVVWVPTDLPDVSELKDATIAVAAEVSASHCYERDTLTAVNDNIIPKHSNDGSVSRMTWWGHLGTTEWIAYHFETPKTLSSVEIYWFDDTGAGSCRVPASWRVLYFDGAQWKPVEAETDYGTAKDTFNMVTFKPVKTTQLRVEVKLQQKYSGGILEWRLP
jgi:DUF1680 family protein